MADLQDRAEVLQRLVARRLQTDAQRLDLAGLRLARPARGLAVHQQTLQRLGQRLGAALVLRRERLQRDLPWRVQRMGHAVQALLRQQQAALDNRARRLEALDPHAVLARGYAWVEGADGRPVTTAASLSPGTAVQGVWADGRAAMQVTSVQAGPGPAADPRRVVDADPGQSHTPQTGA